MAINEQELYGPRTEFSRWIHSDRHRGPEETYDDYCVRYARAVTGRDVESRVFYRTLFHLRNQSILPGGRQQVSVGRPFSTTGFNCFVSEAIEDSLQGIFRALSRAAITMGSGGGIGFDFSTIRPQGERVRGLGGLGAAAGPIEFMKPFDSMCKVLIRSWARGAMMATMRVDHPDILKFIAVKKDLSLLTAFNVSVTVTDPFMEALAADGLYDLKFGDQVFGQARAWDIWGPIMETNWDYSEPGVIFIDRVNRLNPLYYCEKMTTTNPCAEQPLPPNGCCLLGSYNMVKFLIPAHQSLPKLDESNPEIRALHVLTGGKDIKTYDLDWELFDEAVEMSVRAYDNVIDRSTYPLPEQEAEERAKRRMGIGPAGMADALAVMGYDYGSDSYLDMQDKVLQRALNMAYRTSSKLAQEKRKSFPLFEASKYAEGEFFKRLDEDVQYTIVMKGLRNGLLTSVAPTGTISLDADNISGGIEPAYALKQRRTVDTVRQGIREFDLINYAYNFYGIEGKTAEQVSPQDHIRVLCRAQYWIDSSISKTTNVTGQIHGEGPGTTFTEFQQIYLQAHEGGAKSCTTHNVNGERKGILQSLDNRDEEAIACFIDPETGIRSCEA